MEGPQSTAAAQDKGGPPKCMPCLTQEVELFSQLQLWSSVCRQVLQVALHLLDVLSDRQRDDGLGLMQLTAVAVVSVRCKGPISKHC